MPALPTPVSRLMAEYGFVPAEQMPNPRSLLLKGMLEDRPAVLKVTPAEDARSVAQQRNAVHWIKAVGDQVSSGPYHIAPIDAEGMLEDGSHWLIMPYIEGTPLAHVGKNGISRLAYPNATALLPSITGLMHAIMATRPHGRAALHGTPEQAALADQTILDTAAEWAQDTTDTTPHIARLLQIIQASYKEVKESNAHGDFSETNIIINPAGEPVLFDAELGNVFNYAHYDIAEFYNRLYTRLCMPGLARAALESYIAGLSQDRTVFIEHFLCLSALRCIGNFKEISSLTDSAGKQKRLDYATRYAKAIVTRSLF